MKIIHTRPPNFEKILAKFPMAVNKGVIFAYGEIVFVPGGEDLPPEILVHEAVHCHRQIKMGVEAWWDRYLVDDEFRFEEELLAHQAEYAKCCEIMPARHFRRRALTHIAKRLCSPLYGKVTTLERAKKAILDSVPESAVG